MAEPPVAPHLTPELLVNQALWDQLNQKERRALFSAVELFLRFPHEGNSCRISPLTDKRSVVVTTSEDLTIQHRDNELIIDHFVYKETMMGMVEDFTPRLSFAFHLWNK